MSRSSVLVGCVVAAALCLAAPRVAAAPVTNEGELWLELGLRYKPARRLRLSLENHFRVDDDISRPAALMTDIALRYAPRRWFRLATGYRLAAEVDNEGQHRRRHRWHVDVSTRHRLRPVAPAFRIRFQEEARAEADDGAPWRHTLRFRAGLEVRRTPVVDPFISFELFLRLADGAAATVRKLRGTVGLGFDTDAGALALGYRLEGHLVDQVMTHILLLAWQVKLDLERWDRD